MKKAIIRFQYTERTKSELTIAADLLEEIGEFKNDELVGAKRLMSSFLRGSQGEIGIAHSVLQMHNFKEAGEKVAEVIESVSSHEYAEATKRISEAISSVTTGGQQAIQLLKEKGLL